MISESLYIEMMKNCSKWNSRVETERKGRYTVLDPQTGIAQHPSHHAIYELSNRYPPSNPSQYCTYGSRRWKKRKSAPTSDATEMKYILECNPTISDVINQASSAGQDPTDFQSLTAMANSSLENHFTEKRKVYVIKEPGVDMEVEEASEEDPGGSRGGRKNATTLSVNIPPTQGFTPDPKPFSCNLCGAKYKSRPGLNYHRAHVHADNVSPSTTPQPAHRID
ncbi:N-terminal domain of DPF2/REQ family protein [Brugia pahangi]